MRIITKKVGTAGRFSARYGTKTRMKIAAVESMSRAKHECPCCMKKTLRRGSKGVWICRSCGTKIAGGAYSPQSPAAKLIRQITRESMISAENDTK